MRQKPFVMSIAALVARGMLPVFHHESLAREIPIIPLKLLNPNTPKRLPPKSPTNDLPMLHFTYNDAFVVD